MVDAIPMSMKAEAPVLNAQVEHIYLSPGHNFFYRQGVADTNPTVSVTEAVCVSGRGIEGDRFFDHKENYSGQITFFDLAVYDEMCGALGIFDKIPGVLRRNVFVRGLDLNALIHRKFSLQGIVFSGSKECSPCAWMDYSFGAGAYAFLKDRGGLRARIVSTGTLRIGAASFANAVE